MIYYRSECREGCSGEERGKNHQRRKVSELGGRWEITFSKYLPEARHWGLGKHYHIPVSHFWVPFFLLYRQREKDSAP